MAGSYSSPCFHLAVLLQITLFPWHALWNSLLFSKAVTCIEGRITSQCIWHPKAEPERPSLRISLAEWQVSWCMKWEISAETRKHVDLRHFFWSCFCFLSGFLFRFAVMDRRWITAGLVAVMCTVTAGAAKASWCHHSFYCSLRKRGSSKHSIKGMICQPCSLSIILLGKVTAFSLHRNVTFGCLPWPGQI